jgi:hypothetical protein
MQFSIRLRREHIAAFERMQRDCGQLSANELATQMLESSIAEYIRVRLPDTPPDVDPRIGTPKKRRQKITAADIKQIKSLRETDRLPYDEIARRYNTTRQSVWRYLAR